jgi:hypothetical protein
MPGRFRGVGPLGTILLSETPSTTPGSTQTAAPVQMNTPRRTALAHGAARVHALVVRFTKPETAAVRAEVLRVLVVCQDHATPFYLYIGAEAADVRAPLLCISLLPQKRKKGALGE